MIRIKLWQKVWMLIAMVSISLLPMISFAKPIITADLLQHLKKGEPWDRGIFTATKMVMFQQAASGGTDATSVSKITLAYFNSADCTGSPVGSGFYTTPDGTFFAISVGTAFGMVASSVWNVGSTQLSIADMTTIQSIAVTLKSTNSNTPQANFSGVSFACIPVTCTAGPGGQCTSASGTQSFTLKTTAAIGDPANGGVIACLNGGLNNLVAGTLDSAKAYSPGSVWGGSGTAIGAGAQSNTDGATNTAAIVMALGAGTTYAAGLCQAYATTVETGGYNTWFLPAKDQLNCLYNNRIAIGDFNLTSNPWYWSSTEDTGNPQSVAWFQDFSSAAQNISGKDQPLGVRCVQAFTP